MKQMGRYGSRDSGFSLLEALVAAAVFAVAVMVALVLFTAARVAYKLGVNLADQQQATRVGLDRLITDLRLAGFNYDPEGLRAAVDEPIEGAWETAITLRADFDFDDPSARADPEDALSGARAHSVSTGNDEIVTYTLANPGPSGPDSLTLEIDADRPRSGASRRVIIPKVSLRQNDPPYTLYRVTLADRHGAFPTAPQTSSDFNFEPVADDLRSLTFLYFDEAGQRLGPRTPDDASDDIGGAENHRVVRRHIRRVVVIVVGMTRDQDTRYVDPDEVAGARHHRKFTLATSVTPVNLGMVGLANGLVPASPPFPAPPNATWQPGNGR